MDSNKMRPLIPLTAASVLLGVLANSNWYLAYAAMLVGFAAMVGYRRPRYIMVWTLVLAMGAPLVSLCAHLLLGYHPSTPWYQDTFRHFAGALLGILPGLGAGICYRHLAGRLRKSPPAA